MLEFPKHKCGMMLHHNGHITCYETVAEAIASGNYDDEDWVSDEQRQKAIETNECWSISWYPHTAVGFYTFLAADLEPALKAARELDV